MQKKDLIEKISEVFSELPSGWDKFKRPELRAVTGAVFTSIQQQLLAGASGLDVTLLHKALVDLSDKEGDDGSPPSAVLLFRRPPKLQGWPLQLQPQRLQRGSQPAPSLGQAITWSGWCCRQLYYLGYNVKSGG